jgi:hypothetical protein
MLRVIVASWASAPLVACKVSFESLAGVLEAETTVNVCDEFALTVIGDAGVVDVPVGRPDSAIETDPLNPCEPTIDTVNGTLVLPCTRLTAVDEYRDVTDTEKSGAGGNGGGGVLAEPPPHPKLQAPIPTESRIARNHALFLDAKVTPIQETLFPHLGFVSYSYNRGEADHEPADFQFFPPAWPFASPRVPSRKANRSDVHRLRCRNRRCPPCRGVGHRADRS